ncbi:MAG: tyrosine--tRNA ligase [Pseudomonadota bacterium]
MTYQPKSEFLNVMVTRGFLQDCTDMAGLDQALTKGVVPGYIGFDATATSLHVGSLMQIMMLRWLQKTGHQPIALMGGGTSKIGDPSFRSDERALMSDETIAKNVAGIHQVFDKYIDFSDGRAIMANNADWLDGLAYIPFLREVGALFSVNRMLSFESVKSRLDREQSLSFLEFNYMILQAYDFAELNRRYGCVLQMGGSDQWGNIVNGIDLSRRMNEAQVFGLTSPLLTKADGAKMGKSASGAVWLNADMLSPYEFWQFWRNTLDADVGKFLRLYTEIPLDEIARLEALQGQEINGAKIVLANAVTAMCHGAEAAQTAEATARSVFVETKAGTEDGMGLAPTVHVSSLPSIHLTESDFSDRGISIAQLFVRSGLCDTGKSARRLIEGGGAKVNDRVATDPGQMVAKQELAEPLKLTAGKKRHALIKLG